MVETKEFQLKDYCEIVEKELENLVDQLSKIIAIKKKSYHDAENKVMLSMVRDSLRDIENLEKINSKLSTAIKTVNELRSQAELLLVKPIVKESKV